MAKNSRNKGKNKAKKPPYKAKKSAEPKKPKRAETADKHSLYERAVQCVEAEIDFVDAKYRDLVGHDATLLREDFCGTGNTSCEWVRRRPENRALGLDIDQPTLDWGTAHHVASLTEEQQSRVELRNANVLEPQTERPDIVLAMNFSYWIFSKRADLRDYFTKVRASLNDDGIFCLDCFGGYEAARELKEKTDHGDFTYVWDQEYYNPVTADYRCHIHFEFKDGSKLKRAFSYEWRLWTLPEIREVLSEAGFTEVRVFWQGWDDDEEEGDGEFTEVTDADADAGWICYISARG